jgi:hypothetical protein
MDWKARPFIDKMFQEVLSLKKLVFRSELLGRIVVSLL